MPLRDAIQARRSVRAFSPRRFRLDDADDLQLLSDLLWAAWGYISTRRRSAPSSHNWQELELRLLLPEGVFVYDAVENRLVQQSEADLRPLSGVQEYPATAPLNIVLVAEKTLVTGKTPEGVRETIFTDSGYICENIYLFCASEGLATVSRAWIDRPALAAALGLSDTQAITLVQTVGWKAEEK
jgi:nitroreductase